MLCRCVREIAFLVHALQARYVRSPCPFLDPACVERQAVAGQTVRALDAKKMVEAAATTPDKPTITFEEFKKIIFWTPESEA